ncbi:MAG: thymidine phosphorylase [Verrucomicrobiales bacterium]|nr:thymidine phosphorylase [Verrucomicrobiales bacterium]
MHIPSLIEKKRDGGVLSDEEIAYLVNGYTNDEMPPYQMAAFAMAVYFQGMSSAETAALTNAMLESGDVMKYPDHAPRIVDKHSTGGVGDKVSLVLAPLLACDDLWVPMISGRGLGITGGTLDKLESMPGFSIDVSQEKALEQLEKLGVVMMGQTASICSADKKLYALRDVTATVPSRPLIVASIMSKKLAESLDALVLDVKYGSGAFMKTRDEATELGEAMREVGTRMGVDTRTLYHPMDEPIGHAVGNALEVIESIETLSGGGPDDLRRLVLDLSAEVSTVDRSVLETWLDDGTALKKFYALVEAQGGRVEEVEKLGEIHRASVIREIQSPDSGSISGVDADTVGRASLALGAGRGKSDDVIDPAVGFDQIVKCGTTVARGDVIARVHAQSDAEAAEAESRFLKGVKIV